jgi:hypothetical protein
MRCDKAARMKLQATFLSGRRARRISSRQRAECQVTSLMPPSCRPATALAIVRKGRFNRTVAGTCSLVWYVTIGLVLLIKLPELRMRDTLLEENVRTRAYLLWESEGRLPDRDEHYWHLASSQLLAEGVPHGDASLKEVLEVIETKQARRTKTANKVATVEPDDKNVVTTAADTISKKQGDSDTKIKKVARKQPAKKSKPD